MVLAAFLLGKPNPLSLFHKESLPLSSSARRGVAGPAPATEVSRAMSDHPEDTSRARAHSFYCQGQGGEGEHC